MSRRASIADQQPICRRTNLPHSLVVFNFHDGPLLSGTSLLLKRAFILGAESGHYVQQLLKHAPPEFSVQVISYSELSSLLALSAPEQIQAGCHLPIAATDWATTNNSQTNDDLQAKSSPTQNPATAKEPTVFKADDLLLIRSMGVGTLESIVFRMDCLAAIEQLGCQVINPPKSLEWAIDKYASLSRLVRAGLPILPTFVSQTAEQSLAGFQQLGCDVVVKPIFGGEGRGLMRICDFDHAERVFRSIETLGNVVYMQHFLKEARDIRILIVGQRHWAIQRCGSDWRKNTSRGATAIPVEIETEWIELAYQACRTLNLSIAGVDLLIDQDGKPFVLEVNGVPGWRGVEQVHTICIAEELWNFAVGCSA